MRCRDFAFRWNEVLTNAANEIPLASNLSPVGHVCVHLTHRPTLIAHPRLIALAIPVIVLLGAGRAVMQPAEPSLGTRLCGSTTSKPDADEQNCVSR